VPEACEKWNCGNCGLAHFILYVEEYTIKLYDMNAYTERGEEYKAQ
jgi:hypothetical protein